VKQCIQRTLEKVDRTFFDWKGMKGPDRERLAATLKELGIPVEKA
jgi:D-tyrosyl-tRNA(Tyr) deacylase